MRKFLVVALLAVAALVPLAWYRPAPSVLPAAALPAPALPSSPGTSAPPTPGQSATVVNGSTVDTEFGPYAVAVTFQGSTIVDVRLVTEPDDRHSQRIAASAAPTLRQAALQAQNARIDSVSGATTTSEAYAQSLQAALDARGH